LLRQLDYELQPYITVGFDLKLLKMQTFLQKYAKLQRFSKIFQTLTKLRPSANTPSTRHSHKADLARVPHTNPTKV
jgi:hypothetical protein